MEEILKYFPQDMASIINENIRSKQNEVQEIRVRVNQCMILKFNKEEKIVPYRTSQNEILQILQKLCDNSIYSYQNQIINGYITIKGGHRVGITGDVVLENGKVINIKYISSLNFRIAHKIIDCSIPLLRYVLNTEKNEIYNTLIVSSPGTGKTTMIKDLVNKISNGIPEIYFQGSDVTVIDERGEIAACFEGIPQNDLGIRTDILQNVTKAIGIKMAVRSMAPKVIVADEIGNKEDVEAIAYAACSGVKGIFTAHGDSLEEILANSELEKLLKSEIVEKIIFLDKKTKGKISKVYELSRKNKEYVDAEISNKKIRLNRF